MPPGASIRRALVTALAVAILISPLGLAPASAADDKSARKPALQDKEGHDFRGTRWGMSPAQVKAAEGREPLDAGDNTLTFTASLLGHDCVVSYDFVADHLVRAKYALADPSLRNEQVLAVFSDLREALVAKYGQPARDQVISDAPQSSRQPSDLVLPISTGDVALAVTWELKRSAIVLAATGQEFQVQVAVRYTSRDLYEREKEKQERKVEDKL